jgi:hypothetical protein
MKFVLLALIATVSFSAQAKVVTYKGVVASRKACVDDNNSVFSKDIGCKILAITLKTCNVKLEMDKAEITKVSVEIPEVKAQKESFVSVLSGSVKSPWYYAQDFSLYNVKLSRSASLEMKVARNGALVGLYVFTDHKFSGDKRSYKEYLCGSLKLTK